MLFPSLTFPSAPLLPYSLIFSNTAFPAYLYSGWFSHTLGNLRPMLLLFLILVFSHLSHVWLFVTPWTTAYQASLSINNSGGPAKPISIESVMLCNDLILCHSLLLLPSVFPSIRIFYNESAHHIRWPNYWSFSFNISPSNEPPGLIPLGWTGWISLQAKELSRVFTTTVQKHQFFNAQLSL